MVEGQREKGANPAHVPLPCVDGERLPASRVARPVHTGNTSPSNVQKEHRPGRRGTAGRKGLRPAAWTREGRARGVGGTKPYRVCPSCPTRT